mmetsp:Transcript_40253/g.98891  ORF Transcript_40253/g.98891 Transcript_40253/m.98891 type:complete len:348 (+) Transcript_40253:2-1045(+)
MDLPDFVPPKATGKGRARKPERRSVCLSSSSGESESGDDDGEDQAMADKGVRRTPSEEEQLMEKLEIGGRGKGKRKSMDERHVSFGDLGRRAPSRTGSGSSVASGGAVDGSDADPLSSGDEDFGTVGVGEDTLYDPDMDDLDQQFVDTRRRGHFPGSSSVKKPHPPKKPRSSRDDVDEAKQASPKQASPEQGGSKPSPKKGEEEEDEEDDEFKQPKKECEWKAYLAPIGHEYYHNERTGEVTWVKPEGFHGDGSALQGPNTKTDAVLSCPCCFSIVCLDCQQHTKFKNQFRAMFVQNCSVDTQEELRPNNDHAGAVHPVRCASCKAEVGVMDKEEVFHFYDVIPSHG